MYVETATSRLADLLKTYRHPFKEDTLRRVVDLAYANKQALRDILSKSPHWDEEQQKIILKNETILRSFDKEGFKQVRKWAKNALRKRYETESDFTSSQMERGQEQIDIIFDTMEYAYATNPFENVINFEHLRGAYYNSYFGGMRSDRLPVAATNGMKWSRYVSKVFTKLGLNTIVDIQTERWTTADGQIHERQKDMGYNYHIALLGDSINPLEIKGKTVIFSIDLVDYFTMSFGHDWSSCQSIDFENLRQGRGDYHGAYCSAAMSYGLDETSLICYVVDEENKPREGRSKYHLYGADVPYELRDKEHRCIFSYQYDKLYQGRVYPDGRDSGDEGISAQLREIAQQIFAEGLGVSNLWTIHKGTINNISSKLGLHHYCIKTADYAYHYRDYESYSDCNISFLRRIDGQLETQNPIVIGHESICLVCGDRNDNGGNLICCECADRYYIDEYDGTLIDGERDEFFKFYDYDDELHAFASKENALAAGWIQDRRGKWHRVEDTVTINDVVYSIHDSDVCMAEDNQYHLRSDCHRCSQCGSYYFVVPEGSVTTEEGDWYCCEECANQNARLCEDDHKWHRTSACKKCAGNGKYYAATKGILTVNGLWYHSEESAIAAGFKMITVPRWIKEAN